MVFITGDTHGLIDFDKLEKFAQDTPGLTREDYVIIAGDFGGLWSEKTKEEYLTAYSGLPFTVLFVDGNHENFDMIRKYPVEVWNGGKIHRIKENIFHLMRGQIFFIEGKTFFTFGGGTSIDKGIRVEGISWWKEEIPSYDEYDEAIQNLKKHGNKVDYIITHSCDEKALFYPPLLSSYKSMKVYPDNQILSNFEDIVEYKHWYFGHYHMDGDLTEKKTVVYYDIIPLLD